MNTASSSLLVMRTHYYDAELDGFCRRLLGAGLALTLAVDESKGPVETKGRVEKISLTPPLLQGLGLRAVTDFGWRCGDYALYAARQSHPAYSHYFLVEPDVYFNVADLPALFAAIAQDRSSDLLGCHLRKAARDWHWYAPIHAHVRQVWRCLFPFVRLSARAVDELLRRRVALSAAAPSDPALAASWPNDESFVASVVCNEPQLRHRDFNEALPGLYTAATFEFAHLFSRARIESAPADGRLYHAVLSGPRFLHKARRHLAGAQEAKDIRAYRMFSPRFFANLAAECGADVAREVREEVRGDLERLGTGLWKLDALIALNAVTPRWLVKAAKSAARWARGRRAQPPSPEVPEVPTRWFSDEAARR